MNGLLHHRACPGTGFRGVSAVRGRRALGTLLVVVCAACSADRDYAEAVRANTPVAYEAFLKAHPGGAHGEDVRVRLHRLADDRDWDAARATNTRDSYQQYLGSHSTGGHAREALVSMAKLNLDSPAPAQVAESASPSPTTEPAVPAPAPPASTGPAETTARDAVLSTDAGNLQGYRVQLGAYASGSHAAEAAWRRLSTAHGELADRHPLIAAARSGSGEQIYRLQIGGLSRESAEALCGALIAGEAPCVVEPPLRGVRR